MSATTAALLLAMGIPAAVAADRGPAVTFTSQPATGTLVAHYTVTPTAGGHGGATSTAGGVDNDQLPELPVKTFGPRGFAPPAGSLPGNTIGPNSGFGQTQPPVASFIGQQGSKDTCSYFPKGCNPPDMAVAASPSRVFQGVNTSWAVYDTNGNIQPGWPVSAQAFFGIPSNTCDPAASGQPFLSDPRAMYDPSTGRFWAAMLQLEGALGVGGSCPLLTTYWIAVSQTGDPSGAWNVYEFDMSLGTTNVADFTQVGLSDDAVFFSANMFDQAGDAYEYAEIFEANKHQMERGQANFTPAGFFNLQAQGPGGAFLADTVQPVLNLDGGSAGVFVDTFDGPDPVTGNLCSMPGDACSGLAVWRFSNPTGHDRGGPAPFLTGTRVDTKPFIFPQAADEPGCTQCVDANDLRIGATPVQRNGIISAAWGTGLDNGTQIVPGIEWAQFGAFGGPGLARSGYYNFSGDIAATYPAVMPGDDGSLVMLFDRMGSSINPETRFVVRRGFFGDFQGSGQLLKAGEAPYRPGICGVVVSPCRWGDYSAVSVDGRTNRVWFAGQYANSFIDPNASPVFGRNWGTWIGAVRN